MQYLSGTKNPAMRSDLEQGRLGLLNTPKSAYRLEGVKVWAMDNGAFTGKYPGDDEYMALLDRLTDHQSRCLFVAAPDVVGDSEATLRMFPEMAGRIRAAGWPVALVAQDGMAAAQLPWADFDWLFIGGGTEWKLGPDAERLIQAAKARGKRVHVGRVNSGRRFRKFARLGCDSADGTYIAFGPSVNLPRVHRWIADAQSEYETLPILFDEGGCG